MTITNPFRIGVDGSAATCREKYRRLRRYVQRHPEVGIAAGLYVERSGFGPKPKRRSPWTSRTTSRFAQRKPRSPGP